MAPVSEFYWLNEVGGIFGISIFFRHLNDWEAGELLVLINTLYQARIHPCPDSWVWVLEGSRLYS